MAKTKVETINQVKSEVKAGFVQLYNLCASASIQVDMPVEALKKYHSLAGDIMNQIKSKIATLEIMV